MKRLFYVLLIFLLVHCKEETDPAPLTTPLLFNPTHQATSQSTTPTLSWIASAGAETISYDVYLGTTNTPSSAIATGLTSTSYSITTVLTYKTTYYWRVEAKDNKGRTAQSGVYSFTTANALPTTSVLSTPINGATAQSTTPTLSWTASTDADGDPITYDVYLGTTNPPTSTISTGLTGTSYSVLATVLKGNMTYYWQVVAKDNKGGISQSSIFSFTTTNTLPTTSVLSTPTNEATAQSTKPTLSWTASTDADGDPHTYDVYLGTTNPPTITVSTGLKTTSYSVTTALTNSTTYYWQIVAKDGKDGITKSEIRSFTTENAPQDPKDPSIPVLKTPSDRATDISITPTLSWELSTWADVSKTEAISYDIYLGTTNPPTKLAFVPQNTSSFTVSSSSSLSNNTTYYWKIVARDGQANTLAQSDIFSFTTIPADNLGGTCGNPIIYNGKTYKTVLIGTQCWMAENLNDDSHTAGNSSYYDEDNTNIPSEGKVCIAETYGRLYDWEAAKDIADKIPGWHLPTDGEWDKLAEALGGVRRLNSYYHDVGTKLQAGGSSGFEGLLAGYRYHNGSFYGLGGSGYFWSATPNGSSSAWYRYFSKGSAYLHRYYDHVSYQRSVRLLKD